jgi:hypothetical protein
MPASTHQAKKDQTPGLPTGLVSLQRLFGENNISFEETSKGHLCIVLKNDAKKSFDAIFSQSLKLKFLTIAAEHDKKDKTFHIHCFQEEINTYQYLILMGQGLNSIAKEFCTLSDIWESPKEKSFRVFFQNNVLKGSSWDVLGMNVPSLWTGKLDFVR